MHAHAKYTCAELTCQPLTSVQEVNDFMESPPAWRVLCKELGPHSKELIRNIEVNANESEVQLERPRTYCHFDPDQKAARRHSEDGLPRTLVCHDMANGYHDDRFVDGTKTHDAYTFYNWAGIDIFCYFSHHFVTVPPLGWINVAHAHGVKVIGTIITESEEIWKGLLPSEADVEKFISGLVAIAKTLKFDGWLLNVENKIHTPDRLVRFVASLHRALHAELPHALLLWYDSVTVDGCLKWQDALNDRNKAFFDACDGIYTNYSWTEEHITTSVAVAGNRLRDLYIGVDVWGRNFLGGGKFNLQQAVSIAHRHGCSLAIFAPAWTHEALDRAKGNSEADKIENGSKLDYYEKFLLRDRALWDSLWPLLNTRLPSELPFQTSFCRGQGKKRRMYGEVISPGPWYNLRHMQYQPNAAHGPHGYLLSTKENIKNVSHGAHLIHDKQELPHMRACLNTLVKHRAHRSSHHDSTHEVKLRLAYVEKELDCLEVFLEDSFLGGSCLKINPCDGEFPEHRWIRLFYTDFYIAESLIFCVVTKTLRGHEGQTLDVVLMGLKAQEPLMVTLLGRAAGQGACDPQGERITLQPVELDSAQFKTIQRYLMLHQPEFYVPVENHYGWTVRYFEVRMPGLAVHSVNLRTGSARGPLLLGHVGACSWTVRQPLDQSENTSPNDCYVDQAT